MSGSEGHSGSCASCGSGSENGSSANTMVSGGNVNVEKLMKRLVKLEKQNQEKEKVIERLMSELNGNASPRRKRKANEEIGNGLVQSNRFAALMEVAEEVSMETWKDNGQKRKTQTPECVVNATRPNQVKAPVKEKNKNVEKSTKTKPQRVPIVLEKVNLKLAVAKLKEANLPVEFRDRGAKKVIMCDTELKKETLDVLRKCEVAGHSFVTKEERSFKRVLKNINHSFSNMDVYEDIMEKTKDAPTKIEEFFVDRMTTPVSRKKGYTLSHFVVTTDDLNTMQVIMGLNSICYSKPQWETPHKRDITQCHHCLRFGHSVKGGCLNEKACWACLATGDEQGRQLNPFKNFQCRLCKQFGHSAKWPRCPYRTQKIIDINNRRRAVAEGRAQQMGLAFEDAPAPRSNAWAMNKN